MNDDLSNRSSSLPLLLAGAALAGVLILFLLFLGQRGTNRELRAMILNERANAGADAEALLAEAYELNPDTPAVWSRRAIARVRGSFPLHVLQRPHAQDFIPLPSEHGEFLADVVLVVLV